MENFKEVEIRIIMVYCKFIIWFVILKYVIYILYIRYK